MFFVNFFRKKNPHDIPEVTELRRELILLLNRMNVCTGYIHELDIMNPVGPIEEDGDETKAVRKSSNQHHPTYLTMIKSAILALNDTKGASKAAILKYVARNYELGENLPVINTHVRNALKKGLDNGEVRQAKGHGASGSFTVAPAHNMKKKTVAKPAAKAKAVKVPKKAPKKAAKKAPAKASKTSKAKKTVKKAPVKKTTLDKKSKKIAKKPKAKVAKKTAKVAKKA